VQRRLETAVARLGQLHLLVVAVVDDEVGELPAHEEILELGILLEVRLLVAHLHEVERRHGDVDVSAVEELRHVSVEEREDERPDMRAVDVRVRHHDDLVVAELGDVELLADPGADHLHERLDLGVGEHLVDAVLLRVDDLPA
jgi:hypothetical protein